MQLDSLSHIKNIYIWSVNLGPYFLSTRHFYSHKSNHKMFLKKINVGLNKIYSVYIYIYSVCLLFTNGLSLKK